MNSNLYHLIKKDVEPNSGMVIATYRIVKCGLEGGQKFVICKNDKRIGWAMDEMSALQIHSMYSRIHIFHEDNSAIETDALINEMRPKTKDNRFIHEFRDSKI